MVQAIIHEIKLQHNYFHSKQIATIYFGGGTPSLLEAPEIEMIINSIFKLFPVAEVAEITLEANPDDVNAEKLAMLRSMGFNRLSIGIQSFFDEDLKWMNRAHNGHEAVTCIDKAFASGFENLSVDLIYGLPLQTHSVWEKNLEKVIRYKVPHLSCYALTVEPRTALHKMIAKRQYPAPQDNHAAGQFDLMVSFLNSNGYEHYEVSNFAKPGCHSRHNTSYWTGNWYLGIGPSAHSYNGESRRWNISNNALYMDNIIQNKLGYEEELLSCTQKMNEIIMTSLRTMWGLNLKSFEEIYGTDNLNRLMLDAKYYLKTNQLTIENHFMKIDNKSRLLSDRIISDLFFI